MKISLFYEFALPRPWSDDDELQMFQDGLDEVEAADKAGFSTVWLTEHHFLEEYCHATAPEMFLAAASQRTKDIRLGFGVMHLPPPINHPARIAERVSTLDLISNGRVEFGTGEGSSVAELGGFNIDPADKRSMWEEALEVSIRCMTEAPFTGFKGEHVEMAARNVIPKPLQSPHPPVWVACTRPSSVGMAAEKAIGALSFAYTGPEALKDKRVRQALAQHGALHHHDGQLVADQNRLVAGGGGTGALDGAQHALGNLLIRLAPRGLQRVDQQRPAARVPQRGTQAFCAQALEAVAGLDERLIDVHI